MDDIVQMLEKIEKQEKTLVFTEFTAYIALELGKHLIAEAEKRNAAHISIDIMRGEQQLFHFSFDSACADNDEWIKRKSRLVRRFAHSSFYMHCLLEKRGGTLTDLYHLSENEYSPYGGSFPITIKNAGIIGTISVSGLPHAEDHQLIVDVLKTFLE